MTHKTKKSHKIYILFLWLFCGSFVLAQETTPFYEKKDDTRTVSRAVWLGNRILNGSFEEDFIGWSTRMAAYQPGDMVKSTFKIQDKVSHTGFKCLEISGIENTTYWTAFESDPIPIRSDARYQLKGWIKTLNVQQMENQYENCNYYVQFLDENDEVIKMGGSPVRGTGRVMGTRDWKQISIIVGAPPGSVSARIGCVLTCAGTAWFDDVEFAESSVIKWTKKTTDRLEYYYKDEPAPKTELALNDAYFNAFEGILGLKHARKIRYYKYKDQEEKKIITGKTAIAHNEGNSIHTLRWDNRHDIVHILMNQVGRSTPFLEEGIVFYALSQVLNQNVHRSAISMAIGDSLIPIQKLLVPKNFNQTSKNFGNALSGSFVSFLVEQYGIDNFKKLYPYQLLDHVEREIPQRFLKVYGMNLDEAEMVWKEYLLGMVESKKPTFKMIP